ncbi:hypothetical protein [Flagellimonas sp.]|uniref:hypothetical protein n=1 Tax=Flagellimonas sp. TaxID=2058762 RepID=UPI003B506B72
MKNRTIYLLIGAKGSGKSFIGKLMDRLFKIKFVRVEDWAIKVKSKRALSDDKYLKEVFEIIEKGVRKELLQVDQIVFESTGLTHYFDEMLVNLKYDFQLVTIKILTNDRLCLKRVKTRDRSIHINVSDEEVEQINQMVLEKNMKCDFEIKNNKKSEKQLIEELKIIINR